MSFILEHEEIPIQRAAHKFSTNFHWILSAAPQYNYVRNTLKLVGLPVVPSLFSPASCWGTSIFPHPQMKTVSS